MQKLLTFFSKNISVHAIFNDQTFNNTLTNDIISFEQLGPDKYNKMSLLNGVYIPSLELWLLVQNLQVLF